MPKPGRRINTPSEEMAHFTDREDQQELFHRLLNSAVEPPVLVFYGVGGTGKSWLLKKLRGQIPPDIPNAILDFDRPSGGRRYVLDPAAAFYQIRQQLGKPTPRFDLAFGVLRFKQGATEEAGVLTEVAAELAGALVPVPGVATLLKRLSKPLLERLKGTPLEEFLAQTSGQKFALELRAKTAQEIDAQLLYLLAEDLRQSLAPHMHRAVSAVLFFDTFEVVASEAQNEQHRREYEQWIRDAASNFDFALTVIAGQNQLTWDEIDPAWKESLDQHLLGGLSETDARRFLSGCGIDNPPLQDAILATARDRDGGHHCFSLGLCTDIVMLESSQGKQTTPESLRFEPKQWELLAPRFLKSLATDGERRWIERLALTPRFDEDAARKAFSGDTSASQDAAWERLPHYSFVERAQGTQGWLSIRDQMRGAIENQLSGKERLAEDRIWWRAYWNGRSQAPVDQYASLAWYHQYQIKPDEAIDYWRQLAKNASTAVPARMSEHFALLGWWEPIDIVGRTPESASEAWQLSIFGVELFDSSLGSRVHSLHRAIDCYQAALLIYTEQEFPQDWAMTQNNLGNAWCDLPAGDCGENLRRAIDCYQAALRVRTEQEFPQDWAMTQSNLGNAWSDLPTGDCGENLRRASDCYQAALRVQTEQEFPQAWAVTQNNLGNVWRNLPTGDRGENLRRASDCCQAALRVQTEEDFPLAWAMTQNNLGNVWQNLPTGNRGENLGRAIDCCQAALRVYTEQDFPQAWAATQNNLGNAWLNLPTGDRGENLRRAIDCNQSALRVQTEQESPWDWAMTQNNLGNVWCTLPTGDREENMCRAIDCYQAALRVYTEQDFPQDWARTQLNLGAGWGKMPTGDRGENLRRAIGCCQAALRVYTEQDFPQAWAATQNNLGVAWSNLLNGDCGESLRYAIDCYQAALRVYTEQKFPQDWAMTQDNLQIAQKELAQLGG
jgi:tetratricopeptide (TPR) repeat protein